MIGVQMWWTFNGSDLLFRIQCNLHCCSPPPPPPLLPLFPGDVAGSVEVLESLLTKHQPHEFQFKIISSGVGNVTEADIELAHGTRGT